MDPGRVLVALVAVLVASAIAAEVAERLRLPAVLIEILLGILLGPSALGLVHPSGILPALGQIGAILLLFEVGRQMELSDLRRVGRASMSVAAVGVVVPMVGGFAVMRSLGLDSNAALFLSAGITATSVGITARVFGNLGILARAEATTVLGAAVADDILGLLVLAVVVRLVAGDHLAPLSLAAIAVSAIGFVLLATLIGSWLTPRLFGWLVPRARAEGTLLAIGLAVALGFARFAQSAGLAPIVGAFVAGVAVGRSAETEDLDRRMAALGYFLIPVFFLLIGVQTRVQAFGDPWVIGMAGALSVVAVAGKAIAGLAAGKASGSRLLIGVGMIPRGEVGLIFASLGLSRGVLDERTYAVLLLTVMVSTIVAPPWIRRLVERERARESARARDVVVVEPDGGWLRVGSDLVELADGAPPVLVPRIALEAARACIRGRPGPKLVAWLSAPIEAAPWDEPSRGVLFELLDGGKERAWRLLEATGALGRLLPELGQAAAARPRDPFDLDGSDVWRLPVLHRLRELHRSDPAAADVWTRVPADRPLLVAALCRDVLRGRPDAGAAAGRIARALGFGEEDCSSVSTIVADRHLLQAAAARIDMGRERRVVDLASYLERPDRVDGLFLLALAEDGFDRVQRDRLRELHGLLIESLERAEDVDPVARKLAASRVHEALANVSRAEAGAARALLREAPRHYLLAEDAETVARHLRLVTPRLRRREVRLSARPVQAGPDTWSVDVAFRDRPGALAAVAGAFAQHGISVSEAAIFTWDDRLALDVFEVTAPAGTDWPSVRRSIESLLRPTGSFEVGGAVEGVVTFDDRASPWHSIVELRANDRVGLLHRVAMAMAQAGVSIHEARVHTVDGVAVDTFWVTGREGGKLSESERQSLLDALGGAVSGRVGRGSGWVRTLRRPRRRLVEARPRS